MIEHHVLYSFRRCPYAIRARMALYQAQIVLELRELLLKDKPPDMLKHSPKGTVPVLITAKGEVIEESLDVMYWALKHNDPEDWLNPKFLTDAEKIIQENDFKFKPLLDKYKYADRHLELNAEEHRNNTLNRIENFERQLKQHRFLMTNQTTIADIAIFPFIRQYAFVDKSWFDNQPWPNLQKWLHYWLSSDVFLKVMKKYPLFNDGHSIMWP